MHIIEASGLKVEILDPALDTARLGSRYCSGGYVWQVTDAEHGPLFSGPCHPDPNPPPFDGQGAPEVFEIALGQDRVEVGEDVWVLGVGRVRRESAKRPFHVRDNPNVLERSAWRVENQKSTVRMVSRETFADFELELGRSVSLKGRTLESATRVRNRGRRALPIRWFAHPFFPWASKECCRFSLETALPESPGFLQNESDFVERRRDYAWERGCFLTPRAALGGELGVVQKHPTLGEVRVTCRFPLAWLALWGNDRAVSFEPFYATVLLPGAQADWSIEYEF